MILMPRRVARPKWLLALIGTIALGIATALAVAAAPAPAFGPSNCGRNQAGSPVLAEFDIPAGAAIRQHIPGFGIAPELDAMAGPLRVVVFAGPHNGVPRFHMLGPVPPEPLNNVVCVVTETGDEWYYYDIDFTGLTP
jgi:hypothetical protein